ncbi:MAG TPA: M28 family peptidase [Pyrinomonadaceae bacterium]|nr:M28 family peptidase [Pyrinomonadaceae bacterium]
MAWATSSDKAIGRKAIHLNKDESVKAILLALLLLLVAAFSIREHDPPAALSPGAPPEVFSAGRAIQHLSVIAEKPHPVGSASHKVVQEYLRKQLSDAGLESQVQTAIAIGKNVTDPLKIMTLENVAGRLKGTAGGKAVLLIAHYDSMLNSFGASDNGAAIVSLLETLRALKTGPPLKNDVIFLFTDGEEDGMMGARAFATEHRWMEDVGVALNFDSRGNTGPVFMFETSENNGWLIDQFAKAAPYPVAHSLSYELYQLLPNDTDLTLFKRAGLPGLNFANIDGIEHYHSPLDSLQVVDQDTMQHRGSYMLALTRQFGNEDLSQPRQRNEVYFDLFGSFLVHYSTVWVFPLTLLLLVLFVAVIVIGSRNNKLTIPGMVTGFVSLLISLLVASLGGWLLWKAMWMIRPGPSAAATQSRLLMFGFAALAIAITFAVYTFVRDRAGVESLAVGSLLWWVLLMIFTSIFLPGATFIFHWPLLFSLLGLGWTMFSSRKKPGNGLMNFVVLGVCALPAIILMAPVIYQIFVGLTLNFSFLIIALLVLLFGLLIPQLRLIATPFKWVLPGASAVVAIVLLIAGVVTNAMPQNKPSNRIFYAMNTDTGKANWASDLSQPDERRAQFFGGATEKGSLADFAYGRKSREYTFSAAAVAQLPAPQLTVVEDKTADGIRTLKMRLVSPREAGLIAVYVDSVAQVLSASVNNTSITDEPKNQWGVQIEGIPKEGVELQMQVRATEPLKLRLVDQSYGLPPLTTATTQNGAPTENPDLTLLVKSFTL